MLKNNLNILILFFLSFITAKSILSSETNQDYRNLDLEWEEYNNSWEYEKIWEPFDMKDNLLKNDLKELKNIDYQYKPNSIKAIDLLEENYLEPLFVGPLIPLNNFPFPGDLSQTFVQKSTFSGGDAKGIGNQNYSYRFDYGLSKDFFISGFIAEADDPLYYSVVKEGRKNFWRNYAFSFNKKLWHIEDFDIDIAMFTSLEYWKKVSYVKSIDNRINYIDQDSFAGLISFPISKNLSQNFKLSLVPQYFYLPNKLSNNISSGEFYGQSFSISLGSQAKISKGFYLLNSITYSLGPGNNNFDNHLDFYKYPIYSYGFSWEPSPIVGINAKITNSFGETPATSILTIPSGNLPIYSVGLNLKHGYLDVPIREFKDYEISNLFGGLSVSNALIPKRNTSFTSINLDNKGNIFGMYKYSISNIFQLEIINLGTFNDINKQKDETTVIKNTYLKEGNFHNRFGGTLSIFSPFKNDDFWLSKRITIGRDQNSVQGYLFSELITSFKFNEKNLINIAPKYYWSGIKSLSGLGVSISYPITNKFLLIPEYNINLSTNNNSNYTFAIRRLISSSKSLDVYVSNAQGLQDLGQFLKAPNNRFGININFLY